ncbi:MAG: cysteine-rich KTR domain-containing protein [Dorea formicigenerans]
MLNAEWLLCPICKNKTRIKLRYDTVLNNFPWYCPKCKIETLIRVKQWALHRLKKETAL